MVPPDDRIHDIVSRLGNLEGTVRTFMQQWVTQDQTASSGRRVIHERLELMSNQITRVATDVQNTQQDVAELRNEIDDKVMPKIEEREQTKHQKIGAKGVWAIVSSAIIAAASGLAYLADKLLPHRP